MTLEELTARRALWTADKSVAAAAAAAVTEYTAAYRDCMETTQQWQDGSSVGT